LNRLAAPALLALCACSNAPANVWRLYVDATPAADLTLANPQEDALFEFPSGATRLTNGTIVVNDYWAARVLYFDSAGKLQRKVGGHGQGPDEFGGALTWLGQCARDSVFVLIFDKMQIAVLDSTGAITDTYSPASEYGSVPCQAESRVFRWEGNMTRVPRAGDPPLRGELFVADRDGTNEVGLGEFVLGEYGPARPLTRAFARGDNIYIGSGESDELEVYDAGGKRIKTLRLRLDRPAMSDAHFEAALDQYVTYLVLRDDRRQMKAMFRQRYPKPARAPAYTSFYVDPHDVLWVTTSQFGEPTILRAYSAIDAAPIGTFTFAVELRVFEIGDANMLAAFEDAEGFPHVARYRISRQ
jgi:hypothetical protein